MLRKIMMMRKQYFVSEVVTKSLKTKVKLNLQFYKYFRYVRGR